MKTVRPRNKPLLEPLENRLLCKIVNNGEFAITAPGGGEAYETIKLHPAEGAVGLRNTTANFQWFR